MADEMNTERDMPEGITRDDTVHGETYYTAADIATASAQGFRDGVASLSAAEPAIPAANTENGMVPKGTLAHLKLMMEWSAFGGELQLSDALANIDDFATALTQGAAIAAGAPVVKESLTTDIAAGAVYAELPDDVIDYVKGSYAFLQSTAPDGYAEEVFRLPPSATRNQRSLQDALQSDKRGWHPAAARQDPGDGKRSGPDAGVSASHGQAPAGVSPMATLHCNDEGYVWARVTADGKRMRFEQPVNLYAIPSPQAAQQAPAGATPSEPSHAMYAAAQKILIPTGDDDGGSIMLNTSQVRALWQSMLSAASAGPTSPWSRALEIRIAQGWKLKGDRLPVLYTDTINDEGVGRDDLWLCTTSALAAPAAPSTPASPTIEGESK